MSTLDVDAIDLAQLAFDLRARLGALSDDYLDGRTVIRDAVADRLGCSILEAEALTDTLEAAGYLRFPLLPDDTHAGRVIIQWRISGRR